MTHDDIIQCLQSTNLSYQYNRLMQEIQFWIPGISDIYYAIEIDFYGPPLQTLSVYRFKPIGQGTMVSKCVGTFSPEYNIFDFQEWILDNI